jgi:tetratricopeptide (TPR) repeat protein
MSPGREHEQKARPSASPSDRGVTVDACFSAGLEALDAGKLDEAREWAQRCASAPGGDADARAATLQGAIEAEAGHAESAHAHFRRAVETAPREVAAARAIAEALSDAGAFAEAALVLERAADGPDEAGLLVDLGYARMMSGERLAARAAADRAAAMGPGDPSLWRSISRIYDAVDEPTLAASSLAQAARLAPKPRAAADLARLYLRLERWREAEGAFESLAHVDPEHELVARHGQTFCRLKCGDWRGALEAALAATRLDRLGLTTQFLAFAKDRLFTRVPDAERREAELADAFWAELAEHDEQHSLERDVEGGERG